MSKTKVKLDFNIKTGVKFVNDLDDLKAPNELIKMAKENVKIINKINKKYEASVWVLLLLPIGIIIIILFNVLLTFPYTVIGLGVGFPMIIGMFLYFCIMQAKKEA